MIRSSFPFAIPFPRGFKHYILFSVHKSCFSMRLCTWQRCPCTRAAFQTSGRSPSVGSTLCAFPTRKVQQRSSRSRRVSAANDDTESDVMSSVSFEHQEEGEYCMPGQVAVQGDDGPYTLITVQVKDYPGLLRVVSWVLNGLELVVKKAKLKTDEEGFAHNSFWVTDRSGQKVRKAAADLIAERIGDYLVYCTPSRKVMQATVFREGPITVDNQQHPKLTSVRVAVALEVEGALLKVTSALTNSGCTIQEGDIQTVQEAGEGRQGEEERVFKFYVTDRSGNKLDYQRATSLMYTMGLVFGKSEGPLVAPNSSFVVGSVF